MLPPRQAGQCGSAVADQFGREEAQHVFRMRRVEQPGPGERFEIVDGPVDVLARLQDVAQQRIGLGLLAQVVQRRRGLGIEGEKTLPVGTACELVRVPDDADELVVQFVEQSRGRASRRGRRVGVHCRCRTRRGPRNLAEQLGQNIRRWTGLHARNVQHAERICQRIGRGL